MLIIVVFLFGICWFPLQLYNILHVTWEAVDNYKYINILWFCCDWLAMSNSCYNPFIYGIYNVSMIKWFALSASECEQWRGPNRIMLLVSKLHEPKPHARATHHTALFLTLCFL